MRRRRSYIPTELGEEVETSGGGGGGDGRGDGGEGMGGGMEGGGGMRGLRTHPSPPTPEQKIVNKLCFLNLV